MASRYSVSVPDEDLGKQIDYFLENNKDKYETDSAFFRDLAKNFLNPSSKHYLSLFMIYLGYPFIVLTILLKAAADTGDILYNYISSLILGFLLVGLYLLYDKKKHGKM